LRYGPSDEFNNRSTSTDDQTEKTDSSFLCGRAT
jgi:hypothetical protein